MEFREKNELYKTKSMGYRGEAFNSISKSSNLTVITKHSESDVAWRVKYNRKGNIKDIWET